MALHRPRSRRLVRRVTRTHARRRYWACRPRLRWNMLISSASCIGTSGRPTCSLKRAVLSPKQKTIPRRTARVWVTDFGLAHCRQGQAGLTVTGDLVGTLAYMSPEQAEAQRIGLDHRTDIYSLGATLYEFLTLEPAFNGDDRHELLRQIAVEEPRPVRKVNKAVPAELETIVLKAMAKNPAERYATAQDMARDLGRFLRAEPILARPITLLRHAEVGAKTPAGDGFRGRCLARRGRRAGRQYRLDHA